MSTYISVGSFVTFADGQKVECVEGNGCTLCAFNMRKNRLHCNQFSCHPATRYDGKSVIFVAQKRWGRIPILKENVKSF